MAETEDKKAPKTAKDVFDELDYIMYPEPEPVTGGAYDYFYEQFHDNDDWYKFEEYYQEYLGGKGGAILPLTEDLLDEKQELFDMRLKLEGVSEEMDIRDITGLKEATMKEVARNQERAYSGSAAMEAYYAYEANRQKGAKGELKTHAEGAQKAQLEKAQEDANQKTIQALNDAVSQNNLEYLVRGAPLFCNCGSHSRHLDMTASHGVFVNDKAVAFQEDYKKDVNISYFGHCKSLTHTLTETISLSVGASVDTAGNNLSEPSESVFVDIKCDPGFNKPWENAHKSTLIARDAVEEVFGAGFTEYKAALTTSSYLVCQQGGVVYPLTSGQYDNSFYTAPFAGYPFNDFGSEIFEKWCEERGICPYVPGTKEYHAWNTKKISKGVQKGKELQKASDKWLKNAVEGKFNSPYGGYWAYCNPFTDQIKANKEQAKRDYEAFLDEAYKKGLDTMSQEERTKIKEVLQEYLDSGLLTKEEKEEVAKRYAGLRLEYGHNDQKSQTGHIYKDQALYDKTLKKLEELEELGALMESRGNAMDNGENHYAANGGTNYGPFDEATKVYQDFMNEIVTYGPGYSGLSPEQQEKVNKIHETYYAIMKRSKHTNPEEAFEKH